MIIINKFRLLKYKDLKFRCALGKAGIGQKKSEGDKITPKGTYKIVRIYYRSDRIKKVTSKFKLIKIKSNIGWCDDPSSKFYNQEIKLPSKFSHEKFYRKDEIYDLIVVLDYNIKPTIKNKGSAIFIHITKKNYSPTKGCIALSKIDLLEILNKINSNTKIKIG
jgi:L,D-peptidoglycan transpeptidase YkuD (ErfK/YbiS/YcfS/YnhG family)